MANPGLVKSMVAEAAVLPYRVVKFGTADGQVIQAAAAADALVGVADNLGQSTAGHRVDVVLDGIAEAEVGAAVTRGALFQSSFAPSSKRMGAADHSSSLASSRQATLTQTMSPPNSGKLA